MKERFKFNTVGLFTRDNKATVDFYTKAFGFTTDWDGIQPNVEMTLGEMRIILFPREAFEQMVSRKFQYPKGFNGTVELAFDVPMLTRNISMPSRMVPPPFFLPPQSLGASAPAMWPTQTEI